MLGVIGYGADRPASLPELCPFARADLPPGVERLLGRVRSRTALPVAAGFGISRPEHLRSLIGVADAAAVGTAVVNEVAAGRDPAGFVKGLLAACG